MHRSGAKLDSKPALAFGQGSVFVPGHLPSRPALQRRSSWRTLTPSRLSNTNRRARMSISLDDDLAHGRADWVDPVQLGMRSDSGIGDDCFVVSGEARSPSCGDDPTAFVAGGGGRAPGRGSDRRGGGGSGGNDGRGRGGAGGAGAGSGDLGGAGGILSRVWPGWRRRVAADPDFPFKVLMEETVGVGLAASGMIAARGAEIWNEIDFAVCDVAVGATLNFILVYLLSPVAPIPGAAAAPNMLSRFSNLPANIFAPGSFPASQRVAGFLYKGVLFSLCGFLGSVVGTTLSQGLVHLRHALASEESRARTPAKELPNVAVNSAAWAGFMFFNSNPRYQALAGIERVLFGRAPEAVAKIACGAARTGNNVVGGMMWVIWARFLGIQAQPEEEDKVPKRKGGKARNKMN